MTRDMDLVRSILLALKEGPEEVNERVMEQTGRDEVTVAFHAHLLMQAGYVDGADISDQSCRYPQAMPFTLTWEGYEFLGLAESDTNWNRAKRAVGTGGGWAMSVLSAVLQTLATDQARAAISAVGG